jgi:prophage regulatory protein
MLPIPLTRSKGRTSIGYALVPTNAMGLPRMIRRPELKLIVPIADSTIYEMEQRGGFPRRFYITQRSSVWDLAEVEAWLEQRRQENHAGRVKTPGPAIRPYTRRPAKVSVD